MSRVEKAISQPRYLKELAADVTEGGTSTGNLYGMVREDTYFHVANLYSLLSSSTPHNVCTVCMIMQSDYGARAFPGLKLGLQGSFERRSVGSLSSWKASLSRVETANIMEGLVEASGTPMIRILLRRDLASRSSHLLSTLSSSVDKCSTLDCSEVMLSLQVETDVSMSTTVLSRALTLA